MRSPVFYCVVLVVACLVDCCNASRFENERGSDDEQERLPDVVSFNEHIRPLMSNTCFVCHGPDESANESGVRFDSFDAAVETAEAIVPGNPDASPIWQRLTDADDPMPPAEFRHQLTDREKQLIRKWILQGAEYQQHWSYAPVVRPTIPAVDSRLRDRIANPIDSFILARLQSAGLEPSPAAAKETLLRRLSLDLIGLPPTVEQIREFLDDDSTDAYEKQVDRLLASPHYGERMASRWLDLIRFSDTVGFHGDQNQRIFPYRDFVIQSLNENQPFDEFTRWQIAGDLLNEASEEQLIATGLLRLNMMTREGGAQPEEYLAKSTADRVRMIGTAWLGSTTGCCECHNHKYDPFTIEDFYSLGAFFDDIRQWGVYQNYGYTPNPDLSGFSNDHPFPPELRTRSISLEQQIRFLEKTLEDESSQRVPDATSNSPEFARWLRQLTSLYKIDADMWQELSPTRIDPVAEPAERILADGSVLFNDRDPEHETVSLLYQFDKPTIARSLRLQIFPHELHDNRVGRSEDGRFSAQISVYRHPDVTESEESIPVRPRYVRIELSGRNILSLAEVQVFSENQKQGEETNIAPSGTPSQSSTNHDGDPGLAINGDTNGDFHKSRSTTHTNHENNPWWELDLGQELKTDRIVIWNRTDGGYSNRLKGYRVILLDNNRKKLLELTPAVPRPSTTLAIPDHVAAVDLIPPSKIAFAQADRLDPLRYSNGRPSPYLGEVWRSGPSRWQLPADETRYQHTAVYHLNQSLHFKSGQRLLVKVKSKDVGRVRVSVSPVSRFVVGNSSATDSLKSALASLARDNNDREIDSEERAALLSSYYQYITPFDRQAASVTKLRHSIAECRSGFAMTLVSQSVDEKTRRVSRILPRGDWKDKTGKIVAPRTPHFLPGYDADPETRLNRLDLANWLASPDNPLVARSYVNRIWKHFFGAGLSNPLDDLGSQGQWPSHPDLLDWLASEFCEHWDRKQITRLIVTSHTYRQQAAVRTDLQDLDPDNRLLAQQSARRLEAEIVRDNALAISGLLLTDWIGGTSVFPFQPPGYYANLQFPDRRYIPDTDGRQYRRGVYMHWQRTFLHPMLTNFDAPSRDECVADRTFSNSPQQALTLLNDPVFVEACRAFAARLMTEAPDADIEDWISNGFQIAMGREPEPSERESLKRLFDNQLDYFRSNPDQAAAFNRVGQYRPVVELDSTESAALSQVCRVILNLHETITRY